MKTSQLEQLYKAMSDGGFTSLTLESGKVRCRMVRRPPLETDSGEESEETGATSKPASPPPSATPVISERVGVFTFGKRVPLSKGQPVKKGEILGIIKGISIQDNVVSPRSGVIDAVQVKEGEIVEFGRPLFSLAPEAAVVNSPKG